MKRLIVEGLERRKDQMINALWANSNYDDDKGTRQKAIEEIEENFQSAVRQVFGKPGDALFEEEEIDEENNPFFKSAKEGRQKLFDQLGINDDATTVKDVIDYHK